MESILTEDAAPTRLDPIVEAAFALSGRPGAFAALTDSGVSTAAGIPTGWAIVLDLIARVAALIDEEMPADLEAWYLDRFGLEPTLCPVCLGGREDAESCAS